MPTPWKTPVAALGIPRRIRTKVAELDEEGVEAGCACWGVPKLMPSTSSRLHGAWLPGAFTILTSWSGPLQAARVNGGPRKPKPHPAHF